MHRHRSAATSLLAPFLLVSCAASADRERRGFEEPAPLPSATGSVGEGRTVLPPELRSCAKATLESKVKPVDLIIMFDRSSSMLDGVGTTTRWAIATEAMQGFVKTVSTMKASLSFFGSGVKREEVCDPSSYLVPRIPLTSLPDHANEFATVFTSTRPFGSTPTAAALEGALLQARAIEDKGVERPVIIFVTDGLPEGCGTEKDDIANAVAISDQARARAIPMFIVGVGPNLHNLQALASDNQQNLFLIDANAPADLSSSLAKAFDTIREDANESACSLEVPQRSPSGEAIDANEVNVSFDASSPIAHDDTCEGGLGWRYADGGDAGRRIVLCPSTCEAVRGGQPVTLTFGCATVLR